MIFFFKTVFIPLLLLEDFFWFSQFRPGSTALLRQVVARSPHPSAGDPAQARCAPPCAHGAHCAEGAASAQGMVLSPGMGGLPSLPLAGDSRRSRSPLAVERGMWRRRRSWEREVLSPLSPAGCGGRCFPAPPPLYMSWDARAGLVCGPLPTNSSRGSTLQRLAGTAIPIPPSPPSRIRRVRQGPRGDASAGGGGARGQRERMQRESPPPDALTSPSISPAGCEGPSRLPRSPRSAAPAWPAGSRAGSRVRVGRRVPPPGQLPARPLPARLQCGGTRGSRGSPSLPYRGKSGKKKWLKDRNS